MNKIDELISKFSPNGVCYKRITDVLLSIHSGLNPRKNFVLNQGGDLNYVTVKEITTGKIVFSDKTDKIDRDAWNKIQARSCLEKGDVLLSGIGTIGKAAVVDIEVDNWNCSESVLLLKPNQELILPWFLKYILESKPIQDHFKGTAIGSTLKGIRIKDLEQLKIPVPRLEIQREIVLVLNKYSDLNKRLIEKLYLESSYRIKQFDKYRDDLIFGLKGKMGKLIELLSQPITDGPHTTPVYYSSGVPFVSATAVHEGRVHLEDAQGFISKEFDIECSKKYKPKKHDVYMVKSGSTTGKVGYVDFDDDFNIWSPLAAMRCNNPTTSRFVYHLLQTKTVQNMVLTRMSHGSQPNLSMRVLEQFDVIIPSLAEQKKAVEILDRLEIYNSDLINRLSLEISCRQKQYEYYRNLLLTFKELKS